MFNELFSNVDKENAVEQESFVQDFLDNLEEVKNNIFYDEISNEENGIAKDICTTLKEKDILLDNDLINILKEHNNYVIMTVDRFMGFYYTISNFNMYLAAQNLVGYLGFYGGTNRIGIGNESSHIISGEEFIGEVNGVNDRVIGSKKNISSLE